MKRSLVWSAVFVFIFLLGWPGITSAAPLTLQGWGWSSNIGWVKFANDGQNWNVVIDENSGYFSGYAWSNNIGWVKFDQGLTGPDGAPDPHGVQLDFGEDGIGSEGDSVTGWARACSVAVDCNFNNLKPDSARGGWDGWLWFGSDYSGGGGGGGDGFWWWHDRGDNWWWSVFECNDGEENDPEPDGIDTGDPDCYTPDGEYIFYWPEASRDNSNWFGWLGNLVERAFAQGGDGHERIAGFGWGADVLGWLFVDLEVNGDEEPPPPSVELKAGVTESGNWVAGRLRVDEGTPVSLQWTTQNVGDQNGRCTGDWGTGDKNPNGGEEDLGVLPPQQDPYVYTIDCQNDRSEHDQSSVEVLVERADAVTVDLRANNDPDDYLEIDNQTPVELSWSNTDNPTTCTPSSNPTDARWDNYDFSSQTNRDGGSLDLGTLEPGLTYVYSLACQKGNSSDNESVTIVVSEPGNDPCELSGLEVVGDGVIEITSQPLDHEVLSSLERITNTCTEAINVSVKDILSMTYDRGQGGSGSLISVGGLKHPPDNDQLTGIPNSNQQLPQCVLSTGSDRTRQNCAGASVSLPSGETATFGIEIWRPIKTIKDYQPYRVSLGDPNSDARGRNAEIRFEYRVGNVIDE